MSRKSGPINSKVDIATERSSSNNSITNESIGKEFVAITVQEVAKIAAPVALTMIKEKFDDDREEIKKIREDKRANLKRRANIVMTIIEMEEAREKEDYNPEKIDKLYGRLDKINQEYDDLEEKMAGSTKGIFKFIKELISSQSVSK